MAFDFDALRARLDEAQVRLENRHGVADVEALLEARARELAERDDRIEQREPLLDVVVLRRGEVLLGLPIVAVQEIRHVQPVALPFASDVVQHLFEVRGRVYCQVDLLPLIGRASAAPGKDTGMLVALVTGKPGVLGLRIDEILGPRTIYRDECEGHRDVASTPFMTHMTRDLVAVVDVDLLMEQPALRLERS